MERVLGVLLGTLGASLLGNLSTGNAVTRADEKSLVTNQGQGMIRADQDF